MQYFLRNNSPFRRWLTGWQGIATPEEACEQPTWRAMNGLPGRPFTQTGATASGVAAMIQFRTRAKWLR